MWLKHLLRLYLGCSRVTPFLQPFHLLFPEGLPQDLSRAGPGYLGNFYETSRDVGFRKVIL